jgi:hypothetical protein
MSGHVVAFDNVIERAAEAMNALNGSPDRLGYFPAATLDVCIAAELLMRHIQASASTYNGAVEVIQARGGGKAVFVVATSGDPAGLDPVLSSTELGELAARAQKRLSMPCSFIYANSAYDFYLPLNADFLKLFEGITKGFNPPTKWLAFSDIQKKLDAVEETIKSKQMSKGQEALPKHYRAQHNLPVRPTVGQTVRNAAIKDIAACALALHMNACGPDRRFIAPYFELTLLSLQVHALLIADHWGVEANWVRSFASCAGALAKKTQDTPVDLTPIIAGLEKESADAFQKFVEMKRNSLFCAEPRAFAALSKHICDVNGMPVSGVVSQACFWCPAGGRQCPGDYIVGGTLHGNWCYMWPCKSCKARSSFMMAGLTTIPQTTRRSFESPV